MMAVVEKECSCLIGPGVDTLPGTLVSCGCPPTNTRYPPNGQEVQFPQSDHHNAQTKSILTLKVHIVRALREVQSYPFC